MVCVCVCVHACMRAINGDVIRQLRCIHPYLDSITACTIATVLFTPNSITVIFSTTIYLSLRLPASNVLRTLLPVLLLELLNPVTSFLSYALFTGTSNSSHLSLTYKVLRTTQPLYLHKLISVQPPRCTHSSFLITLVRPQTSSSLCITDRPFRYASACLWNQLPVLSVNLIPVPVSDFAARAQLPVSSPLSPSRTPSLFHFQLNAYLFHKSFPP